jgi:hypothetical protein
VFPHVNAKQGPSEEQPLTNKELHDLNKSLAFSRAMIFATGFSAAVKLAWWSDWRATKDARFITVVCIYLGSLLLPKLLPRFFTPGANNPKRRGWKLWTAVLLYLLGAVVLAIVAPESGLLGMASHLTAGCLVAFATWKLVFGR